MPHFGTILTSERSWNESQLLRLCNPMTAQFTMHSLLARVRICPHQQVRVCTNEVLGRSVSSKSRSCFTWNTRCATGSAGKSATSRTEPRRMGELVQIRSRDGRIKGRHYQPDPRTTLDPGSTQPHESSGHPLVPRLERCAEIVLRRASWATGLR